MPIPLAPHSATNAENPGATDVELLKSGASTPRQAAARAGYLPIPLERVLVDALRSIPIYLQTSLGQGDQFTLYCAANGRFTSSHRQRLFGAGIKFIYIPMSHHALLQSQMECELQSLAADPDLAMSTRTAIVYETSLELINQVLAEQAVGTAIPRLEKVARAVSTLVVQSGQAFSHLFATSQHDFYTATHMVNVGTWMTSLAFAMGQRDTDVLSSICTAGMLHDVGKLFVPENILNKTTPLSREEWLILRSHPEKGCEYLRSQALTDDIVLRVALEHHERMDGAGYPQRLSGDQMHLASRICAVVDSFDSMTAVRPYKNHVKSISQALALLRKETPIKYDPQVMQAWDHLMHSIPPECLSQLPDTAEMVKAQPLPLGRRAHERFGIDCTIDLHLLRLNPEGWVQGPSVPAKAHSISTGGFGMLIQSELPLGTYVRAFLRGRGSLANRLVEGKVVRARSYGDGMHDIGIQFCIPGAQEFASAALLASREP